MVAAIHQLYFELPYITTQKPYAVAVCSMREVAHAFSAPCRLPCPQAGDAAPCGAAVADDQHQRPTPAAALTWQELKVAADAGFDQLLQQQELRAEAGQGAPSDRRAALQAMVDRMQMEKHARQMALLAQQQQQQQSGQWQQAGAATIAAAAAACPGRGTTPPAAPGVPSKWIAPAHAPAPEITTHAAHAAHAVPRAAVCRVDAGAPGAPMLLARAALMAGAHQARYKGVDGADSVDTSLPAAAGEGSLEVSNSVVGLQSRCCSARACACGRVCATECVCSQVCAQT